MAVPAPIPSAIVTAAVIVNTGLLRKVRTAKRKSLDGIHSPHPRMHEVATRGRAISHAVRASTDYRVPGTREFFRVLAGYGTKRKASTRVSTRQTRVSAPHRAADFIARYGWR